MKYYHLLFVFLLIPSVLAFTSFENPSLYVANVSVNMTSSCPFNNSMNSYWHNRSSYYNTSGTSQNMICAYTNGAYRYGAPQSNVTPYTLIDVTFKQLLYVSNISFVVCGNNTTPNINNQVAPSGAPYNTLAMKEFLITCSADNVTYYNVLNASPHFITSNVSVLFNKPTCNGSQTCYPLNCNNNASNPNNVVYYSASYAIPKQCSKMRIRILGNDFFNGTGIGKLFMSGTLEVNEIPTILGITNDYVLYPNPLSGTILASDVENDTLYYAYDCDLNVNSQSTTKANIVNAQLNPSKLISDYNQPLDSNGAYACFGYACSWQDYMHNLCWDLGVYGAKNYKQCPNTDEFRTTSYPMEYENSQAYYGIRVNENSSFFWLLANVDASKELSWRAYPGYNPTPLSYAILIWDSSYLGSLAYKWEYNVTSAHYVLYKLFTKSLTDNDTFQIVLGSISINDFSEPNSFLYPDMRFIMDYVFEHNLSFYIQDTVTGESVFVATDNLSKNFFNVSMTSSNYRFSSIMFKPHSQATAFSAFKQSPIPDPITWQTSPDYTCTYPTPGTGVFRAYVSDSRHIPDSYVYADFPIKSDDIGIQPVIGIIGRFVDINDANAVRRFLPIYQAFVILCVLLVTLFIYYIVREMLPDVSVWAYVGFALIMLYIATLGGLLLAWTGVVCSIIFAIVITKFVTTGISGGSQSNTVMGYGLLCYFACVFIFVGLLGQVSGTYGTFESVQTPQGLLPDYNQTNAEQGFWQSASAFFSQILAVIYTYLTFIGRFLAVVTFTVVNIPTWLSIMLNAIQGGLLLWGASYLRGSG